MDLFSLLKKKFVQDTLFFQLASVVNTLFQIILSVTLARLLGKGLYGRYAIIFALFNFFCILLNWGAGPAFIPQFSEAYAARDKEEMGRLILFNWIVTGTIILLVFSLGLLASDSLGNYFPLESSHQSLVKILFFTLFARPFKSMFLMVTKCTRDMRKHAIITCFQPFFYFFFTMVFLLRFGGIAAPIWGFLVASYISTISAYLFTRARIKEQGISLNPFRLRKHLSLTAMKPYFHFSFVLSLEKNLVTLTNILPTLFLGAFSTPEAAGYFKIAIGYASRSDLFFKGIHANIIVKLSENKGKKEFKQMKANYRAIIRTTSKISIAVIILFLVVAPLFIRLYGSEYAGALPVMLILAIAIGSRGFFMGIIPFLKTMRWINSYVYWTALTLAVMIPVGIFLVHNLDETGAAIWLLLVYTLYRLEGAVILRKKFSTDFNPRVLQTK